MVDDLKNRPTSTVAAPIVTAAPTPCCDDSILEKAKKYDSICDNIDEIFAFAKEEADRIISEALEMRKKLLKSSPAHVKSEITGRSESIIEDLRRKLRKQPNKK